MSQTYEATEVHDTQVPDPADSSVQAPSTLFRGSGQLFILKLQDPDKPGP